MRWSLLHVQCPRCQSSFKVPDKYAGKTIKCPACNKPIHLPEPKPSPEEDPSQHMDFGSMEAIEEGGEALEFRRKRWRRRMTLKEAQASGIDATGKRKPQDPNVRICPVCGTEVRAPDLTVDVLCTECGNAIPGEERAHSEMDARYADSLAGRVTAPITFYTGFGSAALYPLPAIMWILTGMGIALGAIVIPAGAILAFTAGSSLNPISKATDVSWVGLFVAIMFVAQGIYFSLVNYHILIDSIRTTASGGEVPPALTWSPTRLGAAFLGYLALLLYYAGIVFLVLWWSGGSTLDLSSTQALLDRLRSPGTIAVVAIVTFMVPMNLIGLASGRSIDGLNPVRVLRSIAGVGGHYAFLFLIAVFYLGVYMGIVSGVMGWAGGAILNAVRYGIQHGIQTLAMGLLAWAVVIGLGFFISYSLGRILGLFARTYKDKLDFDL
jgi:predicted Zn finger-like uncharacterized protein